MTKWTYYITIFLLCCLCLAYNIHAYTWKVYGVKYYLVDQNRTVITAEIDKCQYLIYNNCIIHKPLCDNPNHKEKQ